MHEFEVDSKIEEFNSKNDNFTEDFLKELGIKQYEDQYYIKVFKYGIGAFGKVEKFIENRGNSPIVAVKEFSEKMLIKMFLFEKEIWERISNKNSRFFPKFYGAFYLNKNNKIEDFLLVLEGGDFNLAKINKKKDNRKIEEKYTEEEILELISNMVIALKILKEEKSIIFRY